MSFGKQKNDGKTATQDVAVFCSWVYNEVANKN